MSYTKGKWGFYKHDIGEYSGHIESDLGNHNVRTIATILAYAEKEECLANAKLIASAPELLEAIKNLVFTAIKLWDEVKNIKDTKFMRVTHPMIEEAKQAIAKAEEE